MLALKAPQQPTASLNAAGQGERSLTDVIGDVIRESRVVTSGLSPLVGVTGSFSMVDIVLDQYAGGLGFRTADYSAAEIAVYRGSIYLERVSTTTPLAALIAFAGGEMQIRDVDIEARAFWLISFGGPLQLTDVALSGTGGGALGLGASAIAYSSSLTIDGGSITSIGHSLTLVHVMQLDSSTITWPAAGTIDIQGVTFRSIAEGVDQGDLRFTSLLGESHVEGNTFYADGDIEFRVEASSIVIRENVMSLGHSGPTGELRLHNAPGTAAFTEFLDNEVTFHSVGGLVLAGSNEFRIIDNVLTGQLGSNALRVLQDDPDYGSRVQARGNSFSGFETALAVNFLGAGAKESSLQLEGNRFEFTIDGPGDVAVLHDVVEAVITADGNYWGGVTDPVQLNSWILPTGMTPLTGIMEINTVIP